VPAEVAALLKAGAPELPLPPNPGETDFVSPDDPLAVEAVLADNGSPSPRQRLWC